MYNLCHGVYGCTGVYGVCSECVCLFVGWLADWCPGTLWSAAALFGWHFLHAARTAQNLWLFFLCRATGAYWISFGALNCALRRRTTIKKKAESNKDTAFLLWFICLKWQCCKKCCLLMSDHTRSHHTRNQSTTIHTAKDDDNETTKQRRQRRRWRWRTTKRAHPYRLNARFVLNSTPVAASPQNTLARAQSAKWQIEFTLVSCPASHSTAKQPTNQSACQRTSHTGTCSLFTGCLPLVCTKSTTNRNFPCTARANDVIVFIRLLARSLRIVSSRLEQASRVHMLPLAQQPVRRVAWMNMSLVKET